MKTKNFAKVIRAKMAADPKLAAEVRKRMLASSIAQKVYDLRMAAGVTQAQLAKRINTTQSVISRVEDADYNGHALSLLGRIAEAFSKKIHIELIDIWNDSEVVR